MRYQKKKHKVLVSSKINDIRWRFDFHYDFYNRGSKVHGISGNGRRFECNHNDGGCLCFSSICCVGMVCNSGIYRIQFEIDKIENGDYTYGNILGLTCDNFGSLDLGKYKDKDKYGHKNNYRWWSNSFNWIGWSARDKKDDVKLPNGLYCGCYDSGRAGNIFRGGSAAGSGFKYMSRNDKYAERLPFFESGDIVELIYNSDLGLLSFKLYKHGQDKNVNANSKVSSLDSYITGLPRDLTFYWFCAHQRKPMIITIFD